MKARFLLLLLFTAFASQHVFATNSISKSTTIRVPDEHTYEIPTWGSFYVPSGTLLYDMGKTIRHLGSNKDLFITEDGLHAYISKRKYWGEEQANSFQPLGPTVFIQRNYKAVIPLPTGAEIVIPFTRGETYILVDEGDDFIKVNVNEKNKLTGFGSNVELAVPIPRKYAKINYFDGELGKKDIGYFESHILNGAYGVSKTCASSVFSLYPSGTGDGNTSSYFKHIGIDGVQEKNELNELGEESSIRREYYRRNGENGLYEITILKSCSDTRNVHFRISTPYVSDVKIDSDWVLNSEHNIRHDETSGRALITCPGDYFSLYDELANEFHSRDRPFIMYKVAKWKNFKNECR